MKFLRLLLAVGAGLTAIRALPAAAELNLLVWSEYLPQTVLDKFTAETGIKVNLETYGSNEEMLTKLEPVTARYDLIQPSEYAVEALIKAGRLEAIDFQAVANIRNIGAQYLHLPHDPGQKYSVPYMSGTTGIVVNTERIKEPIKGYADVFSGRYAGRILVMNDNRELFTWALRTLGLSANDVTPATIEKVRPVLEKWLPQVKVFDSDSPKQALLSGDVDIGIVWNGEAAILYKENKKFAYVLPAEGTHLNIDNFAIPKGAPHKAEAERFLNFILRPEISILISEEYPYTNPNLAARKLLTSEQLANPASYPRAGAQLEAFRDIGKSAALVDKLVADLKTRLQ